MDVTQNIMKNYIMLSFEKEIVSSWWGGSFHRLIRNGGVIKDLFKFVMTVNRSYSRIIWIQIDLIGTKINGIILTAFSYLRYDVKRTKPNKFLKSSVAHRPVSILSPGVEILESLIRPILSKHLPKADHQRGFRPTHSTSTALSVLEFLSMLVLDKGHPLEQLWSRLTCLKLSTWSVIDLSWISYFQVFF